VNNEQVQPAVKNAITSEFQLTLGLRSIGGVRVATYANRSTMAAANLRLNR